MTNSAIQNIITIMQRRGISRSYPYLSIAKNYGIPYNTLMCYADSSVESPWFNKACEVIASLDIDISEVANDINLIKAHFVWVQRGEIPWGK